MSIFSPLKLDIVIILEWIFYVNINIYREMWRYFFVDMERLQFEELTRKRRELKVGFEWEFSCLLCFFVFAVNKAEKEIITDLFSL